MLFIISVFAILASLALWCVNMLASVLILEPLWSTRWFSRKAVSVACTLGHLLQCAVLVLSAALVGILARTALWILSNGFRHSRPDLTMVPRRTTSSELALIPNCLAIVLYQSPSSELILRSSSPVPAQAMVARHGKSLELVSTPSSCLAVVRYRPRCLELVPYEHKVSCSAVVSRRHLDSSQMPSWTVILWRDAPIRPIRPRMAIKSIEGPVSAALVVTSPMHSLPPYTPTLPSTCKTLVHYTPSTFISPVSRRLNERDGLGSVNSYKCSLLAPRRLCKDLINVDGIVPFWRDRWVSGHSPSELINLPESSPAFESFESEDSEEDSLVTPFASPRGQHPEPRFACPSPVVADWSIAEIFEPLSMPLDLDLSFNHPPCDCDLCVYRNSKPLQEFEEEQCFDSPNIEMDTSVDELCALFEGLSVKTPSPMTLTPILDAMSKWSLRTPEPIPTIVVTPAHVEPKPSVEEEPSLPAIQAMDTPIHVAPSNPKFRKDCHLPAAMENLCSEFAKMSCKEKALTSIELLTAALSQWTLHSPNPTTPNHSTPSQAGLGIFSRL
ncbi:hypothetical protein EYR36_000391 [Pleurotus pulmonarius]|nr:hypothetical protein EYR36_000391 [Pleurotus pulmonarius]